MKSRRLTRAFSLILAGLMAASLASCGEKPSEGSSPVSSEPSSSASSVDTEESLYYNKEGYPICDETITVTAAGPNGLGNDWNELYIAKAFGDELGIQLDCTSYPQDAWSTQLTLMMTTDDLPDLLCELDLTRADANKYGNEGYFLDMSQYLDLMPNFVAQMDKDPALYAYSRDENGAIYGISKTKNTQVSKMVALSYINHKWLEKVGAEYPQTTEDLYNVLKAFKEQDANGNGDPNDEIPLSITYDQYSGMRAEFVLRSAFGIYGYSQNYQLQADDSGKVYLAEATDNWKEYVKYMNRLYSDGLLDQDCFIQTKDEFDAKIKSDSVGMFANWNTLLSVLGASDHTCVYDYDFFTGVTSDLTDEVVYPLYNSVDSNVVCLITANTQYPEALCRMFDYLYTEDGIILALYGKEGETFNFKEDKFGIKSADHTGFWEDSGYDSSSMWMRNMVKWPNAWQFVQYSPEQEAVANATDEQLQEMYTDGDGKNVVLQAYKEIACRKVKCCDDYPNVVYTSEETEQRAKYLTALQSYIQSTKAEFIIGTQNIDANWDTFLKTMDDMGLQELLKIEQAAYDRYAVNLK